MICPFGADYRVDYFVVVGAYTPSYSYSRVEEAWEIWVKRYTLVVFDD